MRHILKKALDGGAPSPGMTVERFRRVWTPDTGIVMSSIAVADEAAFALFEKDDRLRLVVMSKYPRMLDGFSGEAVTEAAGGVSHHLLSGPLDHANATRLRKALPFTGPSVLACRESFGTGDRIGGIAPATPGHIDAVGAKGIVPVLAQQSVRENHKTGRTFESVMDDATWAVFREGFVKPWGSDADHLKTLDDIGDAIRAGFTMFTLDPSEKIDHSADTDSDEALAVKFSALFPLAGDADSFISRYEGREGAAARDVVRAAVKYLPAIRHAAAAYHRLADLKGEAGFNFEMSIDETSTPTTALDHRIIAGELARENVMLFSLAPRFEGAFEKGVDFRGSLDGFRRSLETHIRLSRELGGYRLSLHSGSDKFSVYPMFGELTDGYYHVKTAGTSYLEAVRVAAVSDYDLFTRILALSLDTFAENAASYQISADPSNVPAPESLDPGEADRHLTGNDDFRQVLHIAFGIVLQTYGDEFRAMLARNRGRYRAFIARHIGRHVSLLKGN